MYFTVWSIVTNESVYGAPASWDDNSRPDDCYRAKYLISLTLIDQSSHQAHLFWYPKVGVSDPYPYLENPVDGPMPGVEVAIYR